MQSAHDQIVQKSRDVVASYAASRGRSNPWSSLSTLLRQMQREYEDRFLYELVQNAYDAHPPDAAGEIAILFAEDESDHGVLYIANRGNPFGRENFDAICGSPRATRPRTSRSATRGSASRACSRCASGRRSTRAPAPTHPGSTATASRSPAQRHTPSWPMATTSSRRPCGVTWRPTSCPCR